MNIQLSLQIGRIKGIKIRLHFTLIIVFVLLVWTISTYFMPQYVPDLSQIDYFILGVVSTVLLFFSILLHELSHSLMSQRYGIPVRSITLFIFGGVSDISKEPKSAHKEFSIAIVGPITSFLISGIFAVLLFSLKGFEFTSFENIQLTKIEAVMFYGFVINLLLGIFNMIPAFPLDGGRILRSILVKVKGDFFKATKIATTVGIIFSYLFMGLGAIALFAGNMIGGLWIILIGWFIHTGAQSYKYQSEITHALKDVKIKDIMKKDILSIKSDVDLVSVYDNYFKKYLKSEFPVVDRQDNLIGTITSKTIKGINVDKSSDPVSDHMIPKKELVIVPPETRADKALFEMIKKNKGRIFVCDDSGKLVGLISKTDIISVANEYQEYYRDFNERNIPPTKKTTND